MLCLCSWQASIYWWYVEEKKRKHGVWMQKIFGKFLFFYVGNQSKFWCIDLYRFSFIYVPRILWMFAQSSKCFCIELKKLSGASHDKNLLMSIHLCTFLSPHKVLVKEVQKSPQNVAYHFHQACSCGCHFFECLIVNIASNSPAFLVSFKCALCDCAQHENVKMLFMNAGTHMHACVA